jgi:Fic family protein
MNLERFQNSPAGHIVQAVHRGSTYLAFVPNPLPPLLELDAALWRSLSTADRALGELAGLGRTLPNPQLLINPFMRREAVLSSRIEGTQAGIADLYAYEASQLALPGFDETTPASDVQEVLNYVHALEYALEEIKRLPVSLRLLRNMHGRLMEGVRGAHSTAGEFRRIPNLIGHPGATLQNARYVPPPVPEMIAALDALEKYLHTQREEDYPPLVRLALIHYQFEAIHPFEDGNGRSGRLLISLLLVNWGLLPAPLLYLSAFFERYRATYYDLLFAVSERGAWREWVLFFLQGVSDQAADAIARAKHLQDLREGWRAQLLQGRASATALHLLDTLFVAPVITTRGAQEILGVTYPAAKANIQKLVQAGILAPGQRAANGQTYIADAVLKILREEP